MTAFASAIVDNAVTYESTRAATFAIVTAWRSSVHKSLVTVRQTIAAWVATARQHLTRLAVGIRRAVAQPRETVGTVPALTRAYVALVVGEFVARPIVPRIVTATMAIARQAVLLALVVSVVVRRLAAFTSDPAVRSVLRRLRVMNAVVLFWLAGLGCVSGESLDPRATRTATVVQMTAEPVTAPLPVPRRRPAIVGSEPDCHRTPRRLARSQMV